MAFNLYNVATGGSPLWTENWNGVNSVQVNAGLFNVLLGSLTPIPQSLLNGNSSLWLGIDVGTDPEMTPRVQLGSVPYAFQSQHAERANGLSAPNGYFNCYTDFYSNGYAPIHANPNRDTQPEQDSPSLDYQGSIQRTGFWPGGSFPELA